MIIRGDATHRQRVRERLLSRAIVDLHGPRPVDDSPCWFFDGKPHVKTGYCQFSVDSQKGLLAHRVAYELWWGELPAGTEIDHLCHPDDGSCPPATCPRTHCDSGKHLWNEENVYTTPSGLSSCRPCRKERLRNRRRGIGREAA